MIKNNRRFKSILNIYFWCGVNVIGLPIIHIHKLAFYNYSNKTIWKKECGKF